MYAINWLLINSNIFDCVPKFVCMLLTVLGAHVLLFLGGGKS